MVHSDPFAYNLEFDLRGHKIQFEDKNKDNREKDIIFTGVPFIVLGAKYYDCSHGVDRNISHKRKRKAVAISKVNA